MGPLLDHLIGLYLRLHEGPDRAGREGPGEPGERGERGEPGERGDVPGWVLVTIMTVGLIAAITAVAQPQLTSMLQSALNSVK